MTQLRMQDHLGDVGPRVHQMRDGRWLKREERRTAGGDIVGAWTDVTELIEAREAAEGANVAKTEFLAMISHEIRTPLNAVIGMASVLLQGALGPEQRRQVETIERSGKTLLALINDVLDLSKVEAGKIELENEPFCLTDVLEAAIELSAERAVEKGLSLSAFVAPELTNGLSGDLNRLRQIAVNLIANAVKFTERGGVRLAATVAGKPAPGIATVRVEVEDTGIGIEPTVLDRLFKPFTQADASTTRRFGGTGLGLTISKQLAELLGGEIGVKSDPGRGSTFWVEIPIAYNTSTGEAAPKGKPVYIVTADPQVRETLRQTVDAMGDNPIFVEPEAATAEADAGAFSKAGAVYIASDIGKQGIEQLWEAMSEELRGIATLIGFDGATKDFENPSRRRPPLSWRLARQTEEASADAPVEPNMVEAAMPKRVLLVEDNRVNQMVAMAMLRLDGHEITVAENGLEALEAMRAQAFDLVFMDMQMPQMDGLDATRAIRLLGGEAAHTPIVAMTANAMEHDRQRCILAGMDDFIAKPIDQGQVRDAVGKWASAAALPLRHSVPRDEVEPPIAEGPEAQAALEALLTELDGVLENGKPAA